MVHLRGEISARIVLACTPVWHYRIVSGLCQELLVGSCLAQELGHQVLFDVVEVKESVKLFPDLRMEEDVALLRLLQLEPQAALVFTVERCHTHVIRLLEIQIGPADDLLVLVVW